MLKIITDEPENEYLGYYKDFIFTVQPDIEARLTSVANQAEEDLHFDEALELYKILISLKPDSLDHNLNIAVCYDDYSNYTFSQGNNSKAEKLEEVSFQFFKRVEEFEEKTDRAYYYLGRFYLSRENFEKAIVYFDEFVNITDEHERRIEVLNLLKEIKTEGTNDEEYKNAVWLLQADNNKEALKNIEVFIKKYPDSWHGYYVKGICLKKIGLYQEAINVLNKSLKLNKDSADVFNELGLCYMNLEDFSKCKLCFYQALKINPEDNSILFNLALCSFKKGDKDEALKYCNVILDFNPEDLDAKNLLKIIEEK